MRRNHLETCWQTAQLEHLAQTPTQPKANVGQLERHKKRKRKAAKTERQNNHTPISRQQPSKRNTKTRTSVNSTTKGHAPKKGTRASHTHVWLQRTRPIPRHDPTDPEQTNLIETQLCHCGESWPLSSPMANPSEARAHNATLREVRYS